MCIRDRSVRVGITYWCCALAIVQRAPPPAKCLSRLLCAADTPGREPHRRRSVARPRRWASPVRRVRARGEAPAAGALVAPEVRGPRSWRRVVCVARGDACAPSACLPGDAGVDRVSCRSRAS
eukprot:3201452-Pleurochrysis_carterae.AAC.1